MIDPGLCSLTLADLSPEAIISLCLEVGLPGIEWWGRDHVPMGNGETARRVGRLTRQAGLITSSYGSYYRAGTSEQEGLSFKDVLKTAVALEAPAIRIWAGARGSGACSVEERRAVSDDTLRIADMCAGEGVDLIIEYHAGTLTDTDESTASYLGAVGHGSVYCGWQPRTGLSAEANQAGLRNVLPRLGTLHVFNWSKAEDGGIVRHPLREAEEEWLGYLKIASETGRSHSALLEFVMDNRVEQFKDDARVLIDWLS